MFKSNKGFTLVELIVVIAILAILAGVAIPVYNGYIKRSQDAAVITELDAIQTAAQAANATCGQVELIVVSTDGKTIEVGGAGNKLAGSFNSDFTLFYPTATAKTDLGDFTATVKLQGSYEGKGATWENGKWTAGAKSVPAQSEGTLGGITSGGQQGGTQEPALDASCTHVFGTPNVTKPATCADGEQKLTCTKCGGVKTEVITATTGHTWKDATCTVAKTCTVCGATDGKPLGHTGDPCSVCGEDWEMPKG